MWEIPSMQMPNRKQFSKIKEQINWNEPRTSNGFYKALTILTGHWKIETEQHMMQYLSCLERGKVGNTQITWVTRHRLSR